MNDTVFVTIVSNNYLHFARTLMQSVRKHHPAADRYCVIVDRDQTPAAALHEEFTPLTLAELGLPDGDDFFFQYNVLELNTAVKPWALETLIRRGYSKVLYIDPDIVLYRPLKEVIDRLDSGHNLVLTPHLLSPINDSYAPSELDIRRCGTYNLGFCAVRMGEEALEILHWWQKKLRRDCVVALHAGIFVDQSWMDLSVTLFDGVVVLRHPGYNVAYWNLAQRVISVVDSELLVNGQPLVFFHYSGMNPELPQGVSKHQNRLTWKDIPKPVQLLFIDYARRLMDNGFETYRALAYGFSCYTDGTPITETDRRAFREDNALRHQAFGQPFLRKDLLSGDETSDQTRNLTQYEQLQAIYAHFLGRAPDNVAHQSFFAKKRRSFSRLVFVVGVGLSAEARSKPGWLLRLLSWPMAHAQFVKPYKPHAPDFRAPSSVRAVARSPLLFSGLHEADATSEEQGIWVGPILELPTTPITQGNAVVRGYVDFGLIRHVLRDTAFHLHVFSPIGHIASMSVQETGPFQFNFTVPILSFQLGSTWQIKASMSIVPANHGLGVDTRKLSWRVSLIRIDETTYIDASRANRAFDLEAILQPPGINLIGYLAAELGVGEAARSLGRACLASGIPFSATDVGYQTGNQQRDREILNQALKKHFPVDLMYVNADQTIATANHLREKGFEAGRYRIGFWHWEQTRLPDSSFNAFAELDEIWVPSRFVQDAVLAVSPLPVFKVPHAIQCVQGPGARRSCFGLPEDKIAILMMYDFHSYQYRKNPQAAVAAFRQAAARRQDTTLVIKTINGNHYPEARKILGELVADLPNVAFIDNFLTRQQTWDLQACCDILISLHRAEGFGLAPAEMMYLGKPVIATGWSGNMDFMTSLNSFPVNYTLQPLEERVGAYLPGPVWAEADVDHAAWCLTQLLEDSGLRKRMGEQAASDMKSQLSPEAVGATVRRRLKALALWYPSLRQAR